jgi:lysophospholipase L1-like esterase
MQSSSLPTILLGAVALGAVALGVACTSSGPRASREREDASQPPVDASHANDAAKATDATHRLDARGAEAGVPDTGSPAVRRIGRFDLSDPTEPTAEWSGSAMEARFSGTSVSAQIGGANNEFAVLVDGTLEPVVTTDGSSSYPLASGLAPGDHEVLVFRRDEAFDQPSALIGFTFGGGGALLAPPVTPSRRIEVIGDSISAGYGDECTNASQHFTAATENEYIAYGSITARDLGADAHIIAWSGKGLYQNLDGTMTETMPILWQRTLPTDPTSVWNPTQWVPEAVVINLGTNDYGAPGPDPTSSFTTAYLAFVATLRVPYPTAHLFLAVGPLLGGATYDSAKGAIQSVIASRKAKGDDRLELVEFPTQNCGSDGSGCGCDYHPNAAEHGRMAKILEKAIHGALGW